MAYHYAYDNLNHLSTQTVDYGGPSGKTVYAYQDGANHSDTNNTSTSLISSLNYYTGTTLDGTIAYTYDAAGNIKTATTTQGGVSTETRYFYDQLGQLVRVDDQAAGKTTLYTYDVGGNITLSQQYAYTTGTPGTLVSQKTYGYTDSSWKDLLTSYNGMNLTYDAIGNPLNYRDGITMTWSGRNLATLTKSGTTTSYGYNADGKRISKTVGSNVTKYYYDDSGRLIKAEEPSYNLWLYYNPSSTSPDSISYYGTRYSFLKNAQDDVIAILDTNSNIVAQYTYDAWGNVLSITGSMASTVGAGNPIRYRSYYYDTDTGLYYLNSRYYDPTTGRFINADDTSILYETKGEFFGANLFTYCNNNPVMYSDPSGHKVVVKTYRNSVGILELVGSLGYKVFKMIRAIMALLATAITTIGAAVSLCSLLYNTFGSLYVTTALCCAIVYYAKYHRYTIHRAKIGFITIFAWTTY